MVEGYTVEELKRIQSGPAEEKRAKIVAELCIGNVLDLGAGIGTTSEAIRKEGHTVVCMDYNPDYVKKLCEKGFDSFLGDLEKDNLRCTNNQIHTVVCTEVLEHLNNPGFGLANCFYSNPERVIITLPISGVRDPYHKWITRLVVINDAWACIVFDKQQ